MSHRGLVFVLIGFCLAALGAAAPGYASTPGRIEGRLTLADGSGASGVAVVAVEAAEETLTDAEGRFVLAVAPGSYTVHLSAGKSSDSLSGIEVPFFGTARVDHTLDWGPRPARAVSRRTERPLDSPVAASVVRGDEIALHAPQGQAPKIAASLPGAEAVQDSLHGFNLNTRGLNGAPNRRLKVLIDGRDPTEAFFGFQEWAASSLPFDDLTQVELARGPSSALYGNDAASGVLSLITRQPGDSQGGQLRLSGGDLSTGNVDLRWAASLHDQWFAKLLGSYRSSHDFTMSRVGRAEYSVPCAVANQADCLPQEVVSLGPDNENDVSYGSARLDRHSTNGDLTTFETGFSDVEGVVVPTDLGRLRIADTQQQWMRFHYSSDHWGFLGTYNKRDADRQTALATGDNFVLDETTWKGEISTRRSFGGGNARLFAGLSREDERIDSFDPFGPTRPSLANGLNQQSLLFEPVRSETDSGFAQVDWTLGERVKLALAARYDDSTLHEPQFSPRASLVFAPRPGHTLRLTYHDGFRAPGYDELFLRSDIEPALQLGYLEAICAFDGEVCGFDIDFLPGEDPAQDTTPDTRVLAAGNADLDVEEVSTFEIGYAGQLAGGVRLAVDYHASEHDELITDLVPLVGTALGRANSNFGPYVPPANLSDAQRALLLSELAVALGPRLPFLSTTVDDTPVLLLASYANFGSVDIQGLDVALTWDVDRDWTVAFGYSWLDFDVGQGAAGLEDELQPNAPENRASVRLTYSARRWDASLDGRWFDDFRWASGPFRGNVDSAIDVDLAVAVRFGEDWAFGVSVANLLDDEHFESFGGDLLERRALASLSFEW